MKMAKKKRKFDPHHRVYGGDGKLLFCKRTGAGNPYNVR